MKCCVFSAMLLIAVFVLAAGCGLMVPKPKVPLVVTPVNAVVQTALDLPWLITTAVLGMAGSVAGMLFLPGPGKTIALALGIFCAVALGLTILVAQYAMYFMLAIVAVCVGVGGYAIVRAKGNTKVLEAAIPQLVRTVDLAKASLRQEAKEHLFGGEIPQFKPGIIRSEVQSPATEKIVAEIRGKPLTPEA